MGFFSWKTQDTGKSICNVHSRKKPFTVSMHDDKGNVWTESAYDGYGVFGGMDFYELLAKMNGKETREEGISIAFSIPAQPYMTPNLTESPKWTWRNEEPESCRDQGFFYPDDDYDDEDDWEDENF